MLVRKHYHYSNININPFTPESDQCQISPPAPPEILHHTVRRTWLFIAYSDERWLQYNFSLPYLCIFSLGGWENVLFELRSERVKTSSCVTHLYTVYYAVPCPRTQSPEKTALSSSKHRIMWSTVWPGVWIALSVAPSVDSTSPSFR